MSRLAIYVGLSFWAAVLPAGTATAEAAAGSSSLALVESVEYWSGEEATALDWAEGSLTVDGELSYPGMVAPNTSRGDATARDANVEPVQMIAPTLSPTAPRQPVQRGPRNPRPALRAAAMSGLASVPYMIGDTGAGTCLGFSGLLDVGLAHPTLACSRLNIAESNSPLPADRIYYSYRRFEEATPLSIYQFNTVLDVDRHTLAFERTYWDGMCSLEVRTPIEHRLSSEFLSILAPEFGVVDPVVADRDRTTELGNISLIFKSLLWERESFALSAGLGVTLPTAQDVQYSLAVAGEVVYEDGITADTNTTFSTLFSNETVYLLPFMAWMYAPPQTRWFHQGFLQVEVAANPSRVTAFGDGVYDFEQNGVPIGFYGFFTGPDGVINPIPVQADLQPQTLLRANLGLGYNFWESRERDRYGRGAANRLAGLFEAHYTTTLQDAKLADIQIQRFGTVPDNLQNIQIGNVNNRVDILNLATGASLLLGDTMFTTGVIVPVRDCPDCGFDVEYNAQVQRRF